MNPRLVHVPSGMLTKSPLEMMAYTESIELYFRLQEHMRLLMGPIHFRTSVTHRLVVMMAAADKAESARLKERKIRRQRRRRKENKHGNKVGARS